MVKAYQGERFKPPVVADSRELGEEVGNP